MAVYGWDETNAAEFITLINEFYKDTNFEAFFEENFSYFEKVIDRFNNQLYSRLNESWFIRWGLNPDGFSVTISPGRSYGGYGLSMYDELGKLKVCPNLPDLEDYSDRMPFLVHEFCHSFANDIAEILYDKNETYRKICADTLNPERLPHYTSKWAISGEYVTRAYTILYMVENENADLAEQFQIEIDKGFPYIADVYKMITK